MALDSDGHVYIVGCANYGDILTAKYGSDGILRWFVKYQGAGNTVDIANALAIDPVGNVYVAAYSYGNAAHWSYFKTIKYSQTGEDLPKLVNDFSLEQNFPNPFNDRTLILYKLPVVSDVTFKIFNTLGQQVASDNLGRKPAGENVYHVNAENLSSGVYFYQIRADDASTGSMQRFVKTGKMVLLK